MTPTFSYTLGPARVYVLGNQPRINDDPSISHAQALALGAERGKVAQLIVAANHTMPGHKGVYPAQYDDIMYWDGAVISEPGSAVVIQTADCASLVLFDTVSGKVALAHAGRPALNPTNEACLACGGNVVDNALCALSGYDNTNTEALIVGDICGQCFTHDAPGAEEHIAYFRRIPAPVFVDESRGALDLSKVITHYLTHRGVPRANIRREGPCTLETLTLASYRRNKTTLRNTIIVVKER